MSVFGLMAAVFQAKTRKLLAGPDDPDAALAHSYESMLVGLQETKRHLADVVAQQRTLERQLGRLEAEAEEAEQVARAAMHSGDEPGARAALVHKQDAAQRREAVVAALEAVRPQAESLGAHERRLAERIDRFHAEKDAAQASHSASLGRTDALRTLGGVGAPADDAMAKAQVRADQARFEADALERLVVAGTLTDPLQRRSAVEHEGAALRATNAVEADLERLRSAPR